MTKVSYVQLGAWRLRWTRAAGAQLADEVLVGGRGAPAFEQYARARVAQDATQSGAQGFDQIGALIVNVATIPVWLVATALLTVARLLHLARWPVVTVHEGGRRSVVRVRGLRAARMAAATPTVASPPPATI